MSSLTYCKEQGKMADPKQDPTDPGHKFISALTLLAAGAALEKRLISSERHEGLMSRTPSHHWDIVLAIVYLCEGPLLLCLPLADCLPSIGISCKPSASSLSTSSVALSSGCKLKHHCFFHSWRNLGDLPRGGKRRNESNW